MKPRHLVITALLIVGFANDAAAQNRRMSTAERLASERTQGEVAMQARQTVEQLFSRLCPGRCELVELSVEMSDPTPVGDVVPGFETVAGQNFVAEPQAVNVTVLLDSKLPRNFQSNLPRMIRYRLANLAPTINVRPEVLDFPEPQLEPMPPYMPEPPRRSWEPPPPIEPVQEPVAEPAPEPAPVAEEVVEPTWWDRLAPFLEAIAPWIGPILMVLVLFLLLLALVRRLTEVARPGTTAGGAASRGRDEIDPDQLRADLNASRSVRNAVLRRWLEEDPDGVAQLVYLLGPEILGDLKSDANLASALALVSESVARQREDLRPDDVRRLASELKARLTAAKILHDEQGLAMDWEFLQGIGAANLRRILSTCSATEKIYAVGHLPASLRSAYLETLDPDERRELVLGTSAEVLSKNDAIALAARLRKAADEVSHIGKEADGQAVLIVDMLRALHLEDQLEMLRELKSKRPEVSQAVLSRVVLETTTLQLPPELLADSIHRTPVDVLASFLRGTRPDVRDHLLSVAPATKRSAVVTELSLDVPVGRAEFLDARERFMGVVGEVVRRDGHDVVRANARALMSTQKINPIPADATL